MSARRNCNGRRRCVPDRGHGDPPQRWLVRRPGRAPQRTIHKGTDHRRRGVSGGVETLAVAAPAQAAPNVVAYYQGYQYGWARIAPESYWNPNDIIGLEINDHGKGWELTHLTINDGSGWENTAAQITQASTGYQFRAAPFPQRAPRGPYRPLVTAGCGFIRGSGLRE